MRVATKHKWLRRAAIRAALALAGPAALAGCHEGVVDPQGPVASAERLLLINATGIMLVVVLPVIILTLGFAVWYRKSNIRARYQPDFIYSGQIELVVWAIPAMIVILVAGVGWIGSHQLDPRRPIDAAEPPLRIQAVSLDWKWLFIYPDQHVATVNDLTVPTGTQLTFQMTSATVMNAFFVPQLGSMVYTMPSMTARLMLLADTPGDYAGLSSHFSGDGFSDMHFTVHAVTPDAFKTWASHTHEGSPPLDEGAWRTLARSGTAATLSFRDPDPALFDTVMRGAAKAGAAQDVTATSKPAEGQ